LDWRCLGTALLVVSAVVATPVAGVGSAEGTNEHPLPDAGLDRTVDTGTPVQLDATASRDPDGRIDRYHWRIETPAGRERTPDCRTCARTRFTPWQNGTYAVTVTVTDDGGAARNDTLYIQVESSDGPNVTLAGPSTVAVRSGASYRARFEEYGIERVDWYVNGTRFARHRIEEGYTESDWVDRSFRWPGQWRLRVVVIDYEGQRGTDSLVVDVREKLDVHIPDIDNPAPGRDRARSTPDPRATPTPAAPSVSYPTRPSTPSPPATATPTPGPPVPSDMPAGARFKESTPTPEPDGSEVGVVYAGTAVAGVGGLYVPSYNMDDADEIVTPALLVVEDSGRQNQIRHQLSEDDGRGESTGVLGAIADVIRGVV